MSQISLIVLAGGFGTRLRSAVPEVPKPLAPVGGRPYLHYLIESWAAQGVTELIFTLHHQAGLIEAFLKSQQKEAYLKSCILRSVTESQPLGTGGAVAYAVQQSRMAGSFLVANADTWLGGGVGRILATPAPAMAIVQVVNSARYGSVQIQQNKVTAFNEKQGSAGPVRINAGLYHLDADLFRKWDGQPFSLEHDLFPKLSADSQLNAVSLENEFIDIGIPEDYFRFCRWIESGKVGAL